MNALDSRSGELYYRIGTPVDPGKPHYPLPKSSSWAFYEFDYGHGLGLVATCAGRYYGVRMMTGRGYRPPMVVLADEVLRNYWRNLGGA